MGVRVVTTRGAARAYSSPSSGQGGQLTYYPAFPVQNVVVNNISGGSITHIQGTPASVWTIPHNLGRYPAVEILDNTGNEIEADVVHLSPNTTTINFSQPMMGRAILS